MDRFDTSRNRLALAVVLIAAGGAMLIMHAFGSSIGAMPWPFFIILPGVGILALAAKLHWHPVPTAMGAVVAAIGLILLVQSSTGYFRSWAYAWTLLPLATGAALAHSGEWRGGLGLMRTGRAMMRWSVAAFIVAAALFEFVFFGGHSWVRWAAPLALVGVGAVLLMRRPQQDPEDVGDLRF